MIDDFKIIEHNFVENSDITVYPISDLHIGAKHSMQDTWEKFIESIKNKENTYVTIGGDMMNNSIKSSIGDVYGETMPPDEQKYYLIDTLSEIKDKILCITPGNHEGRSRKETDSHILKDVAYTLGLKDLYGENGSFMSLKFGDRTKKRANCPTYMGAVIHGAGGGGKKGSSVNRLEDFAKNFEGLDFMIMGHTHKPINFPIEKIVFDPYNKKVRKKLVKLVVSTSWVNYGDYALRAMMSPACYCLQEMVFRGDRKEIKVIQ